MDPELLKCSPVFCLCGFSCHLDLKVRVKEEFDEGVTPRRAAIAIDTYPERLPNVSAIAIAVATNINIAIKKINLEPRDGLQTKSFV